MITREYLMTWKDQKAGRYLYYVGPDGEIHYFGPSACSFVAEMNARGPANMPEIVGVQLLITGETVLLSCLYKTKKAAENSLKSGSREEKSVPKLEGFPGSAMVDDFMEVIESIFDEK